MHNSQTLLNCLFLVIYLLSNGSSAAQADFITASIAGSLRTIYAGPQNIFVPRFNPALGVLQSISLNIRPEMSGTIEGTALGSANSPNGWATGFGGNLLLAGPGISATRDASFPDRSGLLFQPGLRVFEVYGPEVREINLSLTSNLSSYQGTGHTSLSLSWPNYTPQLFFSNGGRLDRTTRDLGTQAGSITYTFTAVPEPSSLLTLSLVTGLSLVRFSRILMR